MCQLDILPLICLINITDLLCVSDLYLLMSICKNIQEKILYVYNIDPSIRYDTIMNGFKRNPKFLLGI